MRILEKKCVGVDESGNLRYYIEASGDSNDDLPDAELVGGEIADGSICLFSNNGTVFFYNESTSEWIEQFSFQSGESSNSSEGNVAS